MLIPHRQTNLTKDLHRSEIVQLREKCRCWHVADNDTLLPYFKSILNTPR